MEGLVMQPEFWRDKRVFLTGHTGFKGSWMALWLQRMGARVTGFALPPVSQPNLFDLARISEEMTSIMGDIRDTQSLASAIEGCNPQIVFHFAAQALVRRSYEDPLETFTTNVIGTANLLEAVRQSTGVRVVVNITSDKCYENKEWVWGYRESDPMGGHDPYSCSKGCAELVTAAYRRSFFSQPVDGKDPLALASVRAGNVIGGGDWSRDRLVPDIMKAIANGQPVIIRNPDAIRPWQHVLEPLSGYLLLAQRLWSDPQAFAGGWNFGPHESDARPVSYICDALTGLWGKNAYWQKDQGVHPHEANFLKLDCSKAHLRLGWYPRLDLRTTLEWIVAWYRAFAAQKDIRAFCMNQIEAYERRAKEAMP
jgi:CDP-glucose 4,6-dehydratase